MSNLVKVCTKTIFNERCLKKISTFADIGCKKQKPHYTDKMSKFRYPVDIDQFQKIREQGMLYVDKTDKQDWQQNKQTHWLSADMPIVSGSVVLKMEFHTLL